MNSAFFDAVRKTVFGGSLSQSQVDGLNVICTAWEKYGDRDLQKLAYLLATTFHETARTMEPIYERGAKSYFNKYEPKTDIGKALGNKQPGDGFKYRGRGYVQLTGRYNYGVAAAKLGLDLTNDPDLALKAGVAARILIAGCLGGWFTSRKLHDYIDNGTANYIGARRVVNGLDKAKIIAGYAFQFERALEAAKYAPAPSTPAAPETPASEPQSWIAALLQFIATIVGAVLKGLGKK